MPRLKHLTIILLIFISGCSVGQQDLRFKIVENGKVGYIDQEGKVVIQPVYLNGADFSEGLAAVRLNGKYGFIDISGNWIIPAKYDFSTSFEFGFASAYIDGEVQLIDKRGQCVLKNSNYRFINLISQNRAIVVTKKSKYELIDIPTGKNLLKQSLDRISEFSDGVAVVFAEKESKKAYTSDYGVIDTNGRFIVSMGKYSEIKNFRNGYSLVDNYGEKNEEESFEGVIDTKGTLLFKRPKNDQSYLFKDFNDGLAVINFKNHSGYINLKGEIVLNDTRNKYLNDFSGGRVFIKDEKGKYRLYDTQFNQVTEELFDEFHRHGFKNGIAIVRKKHLWGLIDADGNYIFKPKFEEISEIDYENQLLIYESDDSESEHTLYGIANFKGEPIGEPNIQKVGSRFFENGLLMAIVNDRLSYINTSGKIIWQEKSDPKKMIPLNTDYMVSGYFRAYSEPDEDDLGGFGGSQNSAKLITDNKQFQSAGLGVVVDSMNLDTLSGNYLGYHVYVVNNLGDTVRFDAQDSRLYMNVQAKDQKGKWRDIEHLPSSWCGNSYHILKLAPKRYWSFVTPVYEGEYKTKLRIKLIVGSGKKKNGKETDHIIYSNEYKGSVNPGQFWNKDHHIPTGIMDPYSY
jgi:hypothetical protein